MTQYSTTDGTIPPARPLSFLFSARRSGARHLGDQDGVVWIRWRWCWLGRGFRRSAFLKRMLPSVVSRPAFACELSVEPSVSLNLGGAGAKGRAESVTGCWRELRMRIAEGGERRPASSARNTPPGYILRSCGLCASCHSLCVHLQSRHSSSGDWCFPAAG